MKALVTLALLGAVVQIGPTEVHESCKPAEISYNLPKGWVVNDEQRLFEAGFIVPPMPLYAVVASPSATPYRDALLPSAAPWVLVTVENVAATLPPAETYELTPEYLQQLASQSGPVNTKVETLVPHRSVQQGGLSGSTSAVTVVAPSGSTSVQDLAYEKGSRLWLIIAGCSASCYAQNHSVIAQIVNSVRVGTVADQPSQLGAL
jgi:hypothetical protein